MFRDQVLRFRASGLELEFRVQGQVRGLGRGRVEEMSGSSGGEMSEAEEGGDDVCREGRCRLPQHCRALPARGCCVTSQSCGQRENHLPSDSLKIWNRTTDLSAVRSVKLTQTGVRGRRGGPDPSISPRTARPATLKPASTNQRTCVTKRIDQSHIETSPKPGASTTKFAAGNAFGAPHIYDRSHCSKHLMLLYLMLLMRGPQSTV